MVWATGFVLLYVGVGLAGWARTLLPDEIRPLILADLPLRATLDYARQDLVQTPGSYLLERIWMRTFGHSDSVAKTLALLLNVPTIVLFAYLASRITTHWRVAALLFTLAFLRIGSAVNLVRMYGLLLLCFVSALVLWNEWRTEPRMRWLFGWAVAMSFAVYAHATALFLLPVFVLVNTLFGPRRVVFLIASGLPVLALVPWIAFVSSTFFERGIGGNVGWIGTDPTRAVFQLPFYFLTGEPPGGASPLEERYARGISPLWKWGALVLNGLLVAFATLWPRVTRKTHATEPSSVRWIVIASLFVGIPIGLLYLFSLASEPVVHPRYLLIVTPAYWLLLTLLGQRGGLPGRVTLVVVAVWMVGSVLVVGGLHQRPGLARSGTDRVAAEIRVADIVVVDDYMPLGFQVYWEWTRRLKRNERINVLLTDEVLPYTRGMLPGTNLNEIELQGVQRVWLFREGPRHLPRIAEYLAGNGFRQLEEHGEGTRSLVLFARVPS
jgi:hypothetical protein